MAPDSSDLRDELDRYLSMDLEPVIDGLQWWSERKDLYPCLSLMALNYLSIPGTFYFFIYNSSFHIFLAHLLMLNRFLAQAELFSSICAIGSLFNQSEH